MDKKYQILILSFTYPPQVNGVSNIAHRQALHFASQGHDVTVVTGGDAPTHNEENIRIVHFPVHGSSHAFRGVLGDKVSYLDFIKNWSGDVAFFHCWGIWTTDLALGILDTLPYKKVMFSHGYDYQRYPRNVKFPRGLRFWLKQLLYVQSLPCHLASFDRLVFLSQSKDPRFYYDNKIASKVAPESIRIISSGISVTEFDQASPRFFSDSTKEVLVVGNYFKNHKYQEMALRAFAASSTPDATIRFIGSEFNEYSAYLMEESVKLGLSARVKFEEKLPRSEVVAAYLRCSMVICSSLWESGPIVLLESMASRKPFISTDVGFASSLPGGIVVRSEGQMAHEIHRLLGDITESNRLGEIGYLEAVRNYDWNVILKKYDSLLHELLA